MQPYKILVHPDTFQQIVTYQKALEVGQVMTGIEGSYNPHTFTYDRPNAYQNWEQAVLQNLLQIQVKDNLLVLPNQPKK